MVSNLHIIRLSRTRCCRRVVPYVAAYSRCCEGFLKFVSEFGPRMEPWIEIEAVLSTEVLFGCLLGCCSHHQWCRMERIADLEASLAEERNSFRVIHRAASASI